MIGNWRDDEGGNDNDDSSTMIIINGSVPVGIVYGIVELTWYHAFRAYGKYVAPWIFINFLNI